MPRTIYSVDLTKPMDQQEMPGHNRWHPDIPAVMSVNPGDSFRVECKDWTDGQIKDTDTPDDVRDINLNRVHVLSGPFYVNGAQPGDVLVVDVLDVGPLQRDEWGFTGIFARENGGGFLTDHYPNAAKAIWNLSGIYATSRHIPGVRFAGISHPGLMGTAPSMELLQKWNARERGLCNTNPDRVPPLATLPTAADAVLGSVKPGTSDFDRIGAEGARTVPPRENGGNVDIKNLSRGSRVYYPVFVEGAKLSVGDLHFSQGDGEISFCGGIEMAGYVDLHVDLMKGGMEKLKMTATNPIFQPGPMEPRYSEYLTFEGISVDENGNQYYMDAHVAYKQACLNAIEYLKACGYTGEQAYMLISTAPCEGRVSGIVDIPNACCTLYIPTAIFERDIRPHAIAGA